MNNLIEINKEEVSGFDVELLKELELFESEAWNEMFMAVPENLKEKMGIKHFESGGIKTYMLPEIDILAFNRIIGFGLKQRIDEFLIKDLTGKIKKAGVKRFFLQLFPGVYDRETDRELTLGGFYYHNDWVKLIRSDSPIKEESFHFKVEEINNHSKDDFKNIFLKSFDFPEAAGEVVVSSIGRSGWKHYLIYAGDKPAGTGMMFIKNSFAWLAFAGIVPGYRGKKGQQAVLHKRIKDALNEGVKYMIIETAADKPDKPSYSFRNASAAGFKPVYYRPNFIFNNQI